MRCSTLLSGSGYARLADFVGLFGGAYPVKDGREEMRSSHLRERLRKGLIPDRNINGRVAELVEDLENFPTMRTPLITSKHHPIPTVPFFRLRPRYFAVASQTETSLQTEAEAIYKPMHNTIAFM